MEIFNRTICVTYDEFDGICTVNSLQCRAKQGTITIVRKGGGEGRPALIEWATLPPRLKARYIEVHGDPSRVMEQKIARSALIPDATARQYYEGFTYTLAGRETHLAEWLIEEYTLNATVLQQLVRQHKERMAMRKALGNGAGECWQILLRECQDYREVMSHTLPSSLPRLKAKVKEWEEARRSGGLDEAYRTLVSAKLGNANTTKITAEAGRYIIALKRCRIPIYSDQQIMELYNENSEKKGWKPLRSVKSLTQWLNDPQNIQLWHDAVHGELLTAQTFNRRHSTELPTMRDSVWYGDGTKLNLYYRDDDGQVRTTSVYEIVDAYSEVLLGYWVSDTEDYEAQYKSFRMAVQRSGHFPYEFVHDNQGGHKKANSAGLFDKSAHIHRSTRPYNGASKTIESIFGRFQQQVLHRHWNFTGQNITAKSDTSRPNLEFIAANRQSLPTRDELMKTYAKCREEWNMMKHPSTGINRWQMYEESQNPATEIATESAIIETFWMQTREDVIFTSQGITITVGGKQMQYEVFAKPGVPDHEWRRHNTLQAFTVRYDPEDLSSVRLYRRDKAGQLRFERIASTYMTIHRGIQEQSEGEAGFIRQEQAADREDRIARQVEARAIELEHGTAPEQNGMQTPKLKGANEEMQREIERRTRAYRIKAGLEVGQVSKTVSLLTFDQIDESALQLDPLKLAQSL